MGIILTHKRNHNIWFLCIGIILLIGSAQAAEMAVSLTINGAIGPGSSRYIEQGLEVARERNAKVVILNIDTPGGLDKAMRQIVKAILASPIPVATYVSPSGARAASAGTYILYASHIAAMAPGTNLGAATPVQIGGGATPTPTPSPSKGEKADQETDDEADTLAGKSAMEKKIIHDASAYIRGLAELRGRNEVWAEQAVREGVSLSSQEALDMHVIDIVAPNIPDLLNQMNGREIKLQHEIVTLVTSDSMLVEYYEPNWRVKFLTVITDPNVAYILMMIGLYGLFLEFAHPGSFVPGVIGGIALLLALYALQMLPLNYAGLGLILFGIALIVAEAFAPSFGILGIGGILAFVIGSVLLLDTDVPGVEIALPLIVSFAVANAAFFFLVINLAIRSRRHRVVSGSEQLFNHPGEVLESTGNKGRLLIEGEVWEFRVAHEGQLKVGQRVQVIKRDGLTLEVQPIDNNVKE